METKPLATIAIMSYNQLGYIRQAIDAAKAQTYRPIEILVSDDGSSDGTWEYVFLRKVDEVRLGEKDITWSINHNEKNLGVMRNWQNTAKLAKGEIIVKADCDDVSHPNRVERIVEEWLKSGKRATLIHSGYDEIDCRDRRLKYVYPRNAEWPLGGAMGYARWVYDEFPPSPSVKTEDQVWAKRAWMLGDEIRIDEALVDYRIGSGITTKFGSIQECWRKNGENMLKSIEILDRDFEMMKDRMSVEKQTQVAMVLERNRRWATLTYDAVMAKSLKRRIYCLVSLMGWMRFLLKGWLYLLPYFPRIMF